MNFHTHDIIIRKTATEQTTWISQRLLMEVCDITDTYLWKLRSKFKSSVRACDLAKAGDFMPDSGKSWRWAYIKKQFYYCLNNIPDRAPTYYRSQLGDEQTLIQLYEASQKNKALNDLERVLKVHLKEHYRAYLEFYNEETPVQRTALAKACAVLDFILEHRAEYGGTAMQLYNELGPILERLNLQYIPYHPIRLKEKIDILDITDHSIVEIIRLPRKANTNALVYDDPQVFSWAMQLRTMDANFSNEHIIRKVNEMCLLSGKRQPSQRWYGTSIFEVPINKYLSGEKRFGVGSRKSQIYRGYIPTEGALFAGDCWEMDATRFNTVAHLVDITDEKGRRKTVEKNIFIVAVRDVHSGDILGYSFDYSENHVVYLEAMKMAVENTGYLPYEWVTDRFPGHNKPEMQDLFARIEALGTKMVFSHNPNEKARIER